VCVECGAGAAQREARPPGVPDMVVLDGGTTPGLGTLEQIVDDFP
jgi:hypothetical protein